MLGSVGSVLCRQDDEFMGRAKIQTSVVAQRGHIEVGSHLENLSRILGRNTYIYLCSQSRWVDLKDVWVRGVRQDQGKVQVSLSWLPVTADRWVTRHQAGYSCVITS